MKRLVLFTIICIFFTHSCATHRKLEGLIDSRVSAKIGLPERISEEEIEYREPPKDSAVSKHDFEGHEVMIMNAVMDEDGDMVATDVLQAAYVTARFRNIAERHGKVELQFDVVVPPQMQDSRWQLRFLPHLLVLEERSDLDPVLITGSRYRQSQLKGYQQYEKFLQKIVSDTTRFIDIHTLEIFLKRNIPEVYALKTDSTYVSDEQFQSIYGVSQAQAVQHYTDRIAMRRNDWRKSRREAMYRKYVKSPIRRQGLRLDTVLTGNGGEFIYKYVQTISTRPGLRNAKVWLDGSIYDKDKMIYHVPASDTLTFYISSISSFADPTPRFIDRVSERRVSENHSYRVEFKVGKSDIDENLGGNRGELQSARERLHGLLNGDEYYLDSIIVTASCSPEGSFQSNGKLAERRSHEACNYFNGYIKSVQDSIDSEIGTIYDTGGEKVLFTKRNIPFIPHFIDEGWEHLDALIRKDTTLSVDQKERYWNLRTIPDPDRRERAMQKESFHSYVRSSLYPLLRVVHLECFLTRKGMVKDTIHTSVPDSVYMRGVQALQDREYSTAIEILRPYRDFNLAVAYCAMDYNASAMAILSELKANAKVDYLLAILQVRSGDEKKAVESFRRAVREDPSYMHRGKLDPEISALIDKYKIKQTQQDYKL